MNAAKKACQNHLKSKYGAGGAPSGSRHVCIDANGKRLQFTLSNVRKGNRRMGFEECMNGFRKELSCPKGGESSYGNWKYR